ncbi:hypothetical protein LAZ67_19001572 [Cordylochernes scorpioides]|uniref:Reverse transcriptase domain-containing protein n=1 Tax=Cordylochernes scorpioides TaxID=51811 RepID=A0ABY6LIS6_9ARAC|nr:hypothetical protein LAZ67_19001572 [Cordylochernes scorpioides]
MMAVLPPRKKPTNAEKSAEEVSKLDLKNTFLIRQTNGDYVNQAAGKKQADANWAERVEASEKQSASESDWKIPKSNKRKGRESPTHPTKVAKAETIAASPSPQTRREIRDAVAHIRTSRHQQDLAKARLPPSPVHESVGADAGEIFSLPTHEDVRHVLVTLSSGEKAERLIEEGLTIGSTLLRAFPYRKRAEKMIIGNLPIAVKDDDIVAALRPYCKVASLAYELVTCEGYSWTTGSREALIFMNEGLKIDQLPVKLEINVIAKDIGVPAVPRETEERSTRQPTSQHGSLPPSTQTSPSSQPAATTPAAVGHNGPEKGPAKNVHIPMKPLPANKTSGTKALPAATEVATSSKESPPNIAAPILAIASGSRVPLKANPLSKEDESSTETRSKALRQLEEVLKQLPDTVFENTEAAGMEKEKIVQAIISERNLKKFLPGQKPEQLDSLINLIGTFVDRVEDKACHLYKRLTHLRAVATKVDFAFVQETNVLALNNILDLCLGYSAVFAPSSTPRGSGLAVVVAPGVTVLWHRVLWPGKIAIASIKIRGLETRVINCHLSHTPEERNLQLQVIAEEAFREDAWALGDFNISEETSSDIGSGAVKAFAELLDRTALVDTASIFNAAHLPTRVASYGNRVDAARLDRVLIPSRLSGRVTRYWNLKYRSSDHRAILLQVGDPPSPSAPPISALLRLAPVIERVEALLCEASMKIEDTPPGDLWRKWGKMKRDLGEDIKCLSVPRAEDENYIARASQFLRSRLEAETVDADYPLLPELGRALRLRLPRSEMATVFDAQGNPVEGESLRCTVFNSYRERFDSSACTPETIAGFLQGTTESITLEDSDPLHRADISLSEVETAISRLPQGKAAGCDSVPCELVKGFEDFFGRAIHRVILESKLRGSLPESSRRNIFCLVPKSHGGPGLSGYRPIFLPKADYRIVSGILLGRLRRHLPAIVPECQTYAVPGRCPSWNIACVSDEVALAVKNKSPLAVISTDLQSAFDNVDREFLAAQLRSIGLPPPFLEWLHLLYAESDATIMETLPAHLECAEGFVRVVPAAQLYSPSFTGPLLRHLERALGRGNVLAYADDILLLIREDWQFEKVKTIFDEFRRASGVFLNFTKSKDCGAAPGGTASTLRWESRGRSVQENHLLGILERAISRWSPYVRGFSLVGRARATNSLVLAAVLHHLHGYLPGDATMAKLQARLTRATGCKDPTPARLLQGSSGCMPSGGQKCLFMAGGVRCLDGPLVLGVLAAAPSPSAAGSVGAGLLHPEPEPPSGSHSRPTEPASRRCLQVLDDATASGSLKVERSARPRPGGSCYVAHHQADAEHLRRCSRPWFILPPSGGGKRGDLASGEEPGESRGAARRMLERPRLVAVPISRYLRRWAPVVDVPSTNLAFSSLCRCSFGGHAADISLRLALHALPHPGHPASSQPVCIACGSSDLSMAHRYWSCSAVRPLIREVFSIIGRPPNLQSWIFAVGLENHAITISSAAKHTICVFFVDREMRGIAGDPLAVFHQTLQRWQRRHVSRQMLDQCRSKAAAGTFDQMVYLEYSPEFTPVDYIKALENKLGKSCVVQLGKASGQVLVVLEMPEMAEKIIEDGLMIREPSSKPYLTKRRQKNNHQRASIRGFHRPCREFFRRLHLARPEKDSVHPHEQREKITDLSKKIVVTAKGGFALAYLEYGFRCSKCYRMGHKRMNCPRIIREANPIQPSSQKRSLKPAHAPNTTSAASPPAALNHPAPVAAPAQTFSTPPTQEAKAPETEPTTRTPETSTQADLNISRGSKSSHRKSKDRGRSLFPKAGATALFQLNTLLERLPKSPFEEITLLGLKEEEVKEAIVSLPHLRLLINKISTEQKLALRSGLACIFSSGVQVIGKRVLAPDKIVAFDVTIQGIKATFINCHLSRAPDERLQQLQAIAAAAVNEDAWVLGDINISE